MRTLFALLLAAAAAAADEYDVVALRCPASIDYRVVRDFDGDGLDDLLLLTGREAWYWSAKGGFGADPDAKRTMPEGAALFDVGHVDGAAQELVVRTATQFWAIPMAGGEARVLRPAGGGLPKNPRNILWRGFWRDFDADGQRDFIEAGLDGYRILYGDGSRVDLPARLTEQVQTGARAASERHIERIAVGAWTDGNFDGDLRPDFAVLTDTGLLVYPGDREGRFDPKRRLAIDFEEAKDADLVFHDVNHDGQTDVLALARKTGKTTVLVAHPEQGLRRPHRTRLALPGEIRLAVLEDLDGDRLPDLALPFLPSLTIEDLVRVATRGEVLIKVPIFLNRGGTSCFPRLADAQLTVPVRVRVASDAAGRLRTSGLVVVEHGGDLDGDGRRDLLVTERTDTLAVHLGVPSRVFHEDVAFRIAVPDCADFGSVKSEAAGLNADERSDIILHYRGEGRRPDRIYLLLSRKK